MIHLTTEQRRIIDLLHALNRARDRFNNDGSQRAYDIVCRIDQQRLRWCARLDATGFTDCIDEYPRTW